MFFTKSALTVLDGVATVLAVPSKVCTLLRDHLKSYADRDEEYAKKANRGVGIVVGILFLLGFLAVFPIFNQPSFSSINYSDPALLNRIAALEAENKSLKAQLGINGSTPAPPAAEK